MADPMKNDFQNARKRGLHGWAQWRTDINDRLAESAKCGTPIPDMDPIQKYLRKQLPKHHPAKNPQILMSYSADTAKSTCLQRDNYLIYGIPRAKVNPKLSQSMTNLQLENHENMGRYGDSDSSNSGSCPDYVRGGDTKYMNMIQSTIDVHDPILNRNVLRRTHIEPLPEVRHFQPEGPNPGDYYIGFEQETEKRPTPKWKYNHDRDHNIRNSGIEFDSHYF